MLWLVASAVANAAWLRSPLGNLTWDGQIWTWTSQGETWPVDVAVLFDGQSVLLLRLQALQTVFWLWPQQRMVKARWLAFRRAAFALQPAAHHPDVIGVSP
jgi:hypothetical protein